MCGIAAAYSRAGAAPLDEQAVRRIAARQAHRGPDRVQVVARPRCVLGANRLRIVDPRPEADQPVASEDGQVSVLLNGEVFNHLELRASLERAGVHFRSGSDTETVLRLYLERGADLLRELEGQFALCIFDERRGRLLLARDRLGICPLYVVEQGDVVYAASSVQALLAGVRGVTWTVDREAVGEYLLLRHVLAPRTVLRQVRQVRPAEVVLYEGGARQALLYWQVGGVPPVADRREEEERLRACVLRSVRRQVPAEVPVAAFLSGGLDSSAVVAAACAGRGEPLDTLSIHLGGYSLEETAHALAAARAFGCRHQVYRPEPGDLRGLAMGCLEAMDHPTGARDAVAAYGLALTLKARLPETKVVLTGTGADELFAGYSSAYFQAAPGGLEEQCRRYVRAYSCLSPGGRAALEGVAAAPLPEADVAAEVVKRIRRLHPGLDAGDPVNVLCAFYLVCHLAGWELPVQDAMCMAWSLEPRVPFLGREVVEVAMAIPGPRKVEGGREKAVLRDALGPLLPDLIRDRPKLPLSRPVAGWLGQHGVQDLFREVAFRDRGLLRLDRLHSANVLAELDVFWRLAALELWLQRNVD